MPDERDSSSRIELICAGTVDMLQPVLLSLSIAPSEFAVMEHTFPKETGPTFRRYAVVRRASESMLDIGTIDTSQLPGGRALITLFPGKRAFMADIKEYTTQHRAWFDEFTQVLVARLAVLGFVQLDDPGPAQRPFGFKRPKSE